MQISCTITVTPPRPHASSTWSISAINKLHRTCKTILLESCLQPDSNRSNLPLFTAFKQSCEPIRLPLLHAGHNKILQEHGLSELFSSACSHQSFSSHFSTTSLALLSHYSHTAAIQELENTTSNRDNSFSQGHEFVGGHLQHGRLSLCQLLPASLKPNSHVFHSVTAKRD